MTGIKWSGALCHAKLTPHKNDIGSPILCTQFLLHGVHMKNELHKLRQYLNVQLRRSFCYIIRPRRFHIRSLVHGNRQLKCWREVTHSARVNQVERQRLRVSGLILKVPGQKTINIVQGPRNYRRSRCSFPHVGVARISLTFQIDPFGGLSIPHYISGTFGGCYQGENFVCWRAESGDTHQSRKKIDQGKLNIFI